MERAKVNLIDSQIRGYNINLNGNDTVTGAIVKLKRLENAFKDRCWQLKRQYEGRFKNAFRGHLHKKDSFRDRILHEKSKNNSSLLPLDELESRANTLFSSKPLNENPISIPNISRLLNHESNPILSKKVIGKTDVDIASLIVRLGNSDWVRQGREYYDSKEQVCPFCQQKTKASLEKSLNDYFDETFQAETDEIETLHRRYSYDAEILIRALDQIRQDPSPRLDKDVFATNCNLLRSRINENLRWIERKKQESSTPITLVPLTSVFAPITTILRKVNAEIKKYNGMVARFSAERSKLIGQVWRYLLDREIKGDLDSYITTKARLVGGIKILKSKIESANTERKKIERTIRLLEKDTTSVQPTIDDINSILKFFDFQGFSLAKSNCGRFYAITRSDGSDAKDTLSEGERSFIAFLYFYHLLKGSTSESGVTTKRIVVFDDPVSSLDSQVLFVVSSLIKKVIEDVREDSSTVQQAFVFTHNVYFHKEVSYNTGRNYPEQILSDETFWIIRRSTDTIPS